MQLTVFAVGRMKNGPERELTGRYLDRLEKAGPSIGLPFAGVTEIAESRTSDADRRKAEEGAHCLSLAEDRTTALVAFDEGGQTLSSSEFADWIARQRDDGRKRALFAIGGPDGHAPAVLERSDLTVSLGRMTWPHQIARILVAEQLYRAVSILAGHPYHRP